METTRRTLLVAMTGVLFTNSGCVSNNKGVKVTQSNIKIVESSCGNTKNSATIQSARENEVILKGTLETNHLCDELSSAVYTSERSDRVIVELRSRTPENSNCKNCSASLEYRLDLGLQPKPFKIILQYIRNGKSIGIIGKLNTSN